MGGATRAGRGAALTGTLRCVAAADKRVGEAAGTRRRAGAAGPDPRLKAAALNTNSRSNGTRPFALQDVVWRMSSPSTLSCIR